MYDRSFSKDNKLENFKKYLKDKGYSKYNS